jgi:hypothetical protein
MLQLLDTPDCALHDLKCIQYSRWKFTALNSRFDESKRTKCGSNAIVKWVTIIRLHCY